MDEQFKFYVGRDGDGTLNITNGGLISVGGTLIIDENGDGDGFVNIATGGMLTLLGNASDSLGDFLGLVDGTDAIRYWDDSISNWSDITGATRDEDYTLKYISNGDLAGYTMLTVGMLDQLYGDANRDGVVSAGDYAAVQGLFGFVGKPGLIGDANLDGVVSAGDYASVQANFGNTAAGVEVGATPEPATLSLLAVGGIMLLRRKRK